MYTNPWKDEANVALLRQLYAEGHSASHIAARIGGVSRNAVIGKAHRLGLVGPVPRRSKSKAQASIEGRNSGWKRPKKMTTPRTRRIAELIAAEPYVPQLQIIIPEHEQKTLIELGDHECRFPLNDGNPFKFCAREREKGLPYCRQHARIAYAEPPLARSRHSTPAQTNASAKEEKVHA